MGIDEYEIQVDVTEEPSPEVVAEKASVQLRRRKKEMVLASAIPANQTLINDYDSAWLVGAHPTVFPWKTGGRHKDGPLSEKKWCNLLLRRYPRKQFAQNPAFIADMFNILQRHSVNTNAAVAFRFSPSQSAKIANISEDAINGVIDLIKHRAYGNDLFNKLQALGEVVDSIHMRGFDYSKMIDAGDGARTLYNGIQSTGGRIIGTPQSFRKLRSKVMSATTILGPYTCQLNLCPNEFIAKWVFDLTDDADTQYNVDIAGKPSKDFHITQCKKIVTAHPVAVSRILRFRIVESVFDVLKFLMKPSLMRRRLQNF